jgi:hypothetical protein
MATVGLANLRTPVERIKYPRAALVRFPRGATVGTPNRPEQQRSVLRDTLALLASATAPGTIVELPYRWEGTQA